MNYSNYILFDLETTGLNKNDDAQIVQIAALCADCRTLKIKQGSQFQTLVKPLYGEEAAQANLEELSDAAIKVHGKTHEMLESAPDAHSVIKNFVNFVNQYNWKGTDFSKPIAVTYNGIGFDLPIIERYFKKFGFENPFHRIYKVDMMDHMFTTFENDKNVNRLSLDNLVRGYMGYKDPDGMKGHDAMADVLLLHSLFERYMKLIRKLNKNTKFAGAMSDRKV